MSETEVEVGVMMVVVVIIMEVMMVEVMLVVVVVMVEVMIVMMAMMVLMVEVVLLVTMLRSRAGLITLSVFSREEDPWITAGGGWHYTCQASLSSQQAASYYRSYYAQVDQQTACKSELNDCCILMD